MQQQQAERTYQKAIQFHQQGKFKAAEAEYRKILRAFPELQPVLTNLGGVLFSQGKHEAALRYLDKALALNPLNLDAFANRAAVLYAQGAREQAVTAYRQLAEMDSKNASSQYNLANVLVETGELADAEKYFRKAIALSAELYQAHYNLGMLQVRQGHTDAARQSFIRTLAIQPGYAAAAVNLGNLEMDLGHLSAAEAAYSTAIEVDANYLLGYQARAKLRLDLGKAGAALLDLDVAYSLNDRDVGILTLRGNALDTLGKVDAAEEMYRKALEIEPGNKAADSNLRRLWSKQVPAWHFVMLADAGRNAAFEAAITRAVRPDSVVLDIGTGSGLLAMMAARAGARQVVACELSRPVAAAAQDIIAANGFAETVSVLNKSSAELVIGQEMPQKANLIVSEILDAALLGEGVLPSLRHAAQELAAEDAVMIPAGATAWAQLIALPKLRRVNPLREVSGFDLSEFSRFQRRESNLVVHLERETHTLLSAPLRLETFDFMQLPAAISDLQPKSFDLQFEVTASGTAHAILIWFDLRMDEQLTVSSGLGGEMDHWGQTACFLPEDIELEAGVKVRVPLYRTDTTWLSY